MGLLGGVSGLFGCGSGPQRGGEASGADGSSRRLVNIGYEDETLSLGVVPVAATTTYTGDWFPHLEDRLRGTRVVGNAGEPNLEDVALADPDLTLADRYHEPEIGDELEEISRTEFVAFTVHGGTRGAGENLSNVGAALGLRGRAGERFARHEEKMGRARDRLRGFSGTVAFLRVLEAEYRLVTTDYGYIGPVIYGDLGLEPPPYVVEVNEKDRKKKYGYVNVSLELIPEIKADHVFFLSENDETLSELEGSPLWRSTAAVKGGRIHKVNPVYWQTTAVLANEAKAQDVVEALAA